MQGVSTLRRSVFVARSRHKNAVERNRSGSPFGILRQAAPLGKHIRALVGGWSVSARRGQRSQDADTRWEPGASGRGGRALPATVSGRRAEGWQGATVPESRGGDEVGIGGQHGSAVSHGGSRQGGGAGGSRPAGPGRSAGSSDPPGGEATRRRANGAPPPGTLGVRVVLAPPGRAGVGARGDDGQDSTDHSTGLCGTPGATHAAGSGG